MNTNPDSPLPDVEDDAWNEMRVQLQRSLATVVAALMKHTNADGCQAPCGEFTITIERNTEVGTKH